MKSPGPEQVSVFSALLAQAVHTPPGMQAIHRGEAQFLQVPASSHWLAEQVQSATFPALFEQAVHTPEELQAVHWSGAQATQVLPLSHWPVGQEQVFKSVALLEH